MKTYEYAPTTHPDLFRVVDRDGDWTHYWHKPSNTFLPSVNFRLDTGFTKGARFYEYLKNGSKDDLEKKLQFAGERGDRIHQAIKLVLSGAIVDRHTKVLAEDNKTYVELSNDEWDALLAWQEFWNRHDCVLIAFEFAVFDRQFAGGYAGTADAIIRMRKSCGNRYCKCTPFIGTLGLVDWKSSGAIYESYGSQVEAYAQAESTRQLLKGQKIEWTGIVRIGTNHKSTGGYEFCPFDVDARMKNWSRFLSAIDISSAYVKPFDATTEIFDIPDTLTVKVEVEKIPEPEEKPAKPKAKRTPRKGKKVVTKEPEKNA